MAQITLEANDDLVAALKEMGFYKKPEEGEKPDLNQQIADKLKNLSGLRDVAASEMGAHDNIKEGLKQRGIGYAK
jgi:hypothetical protein